MKLIFSLTALFCFILLWAGNSGAVNEKLYIALMSERGVAVADLETMDAWGVIKTGEGPALLKAMPDKKNILVTIYREAKVQIIDSATDGVLRDIKTGNSPFTLDISPDGLNAVVCNTEDESVSVLDLKEFKEKARIKLPSNVFEVKISNKDIAFLVSPAGELYLLDLKDFEIKKTIKIPEEIYQIAFSINEEKLYLNSLEEKKIYSMDMQNFKVDLLPDADAGGQGLAISPDGNELWFGGPDSKITAYSLKESKVLAVMPRDTATNLSILFDDEGKKVFAGPAGKDARSIYVFDVRKKIKIGEIGLNGLPRGLYYYSGCRAKK